MKVGGIVWGGKLEPLKKRWIGEPEAEEGVLRRIRRKKEE